MALNSINDLIERDRELRKKHNKDDADSIIADPDLEETVVSLVDDLERKLLSLKSKNNIDRLNLIILFWRPIYYLCRIQNVYLGIERIPNYSPVDPAPGGDFLYKRDCFRRMGHEDATITQDEADIRSLTAVVYRKYTDDTYATVDPAPLIATDISEPPPERHIPVAIYTRVCGHSPKGDDGCGEMPVGGVAA